MKYPTRTGYGGMNTKRDRRHARFIFAFFRSEGRDSNVDTNSTICTNPGITDVWVSFQRHRIRSPAAANVGCRRLARLVRGVLPVRGLAPADLLGFIGHEALAETLEAVELNPAGA